jgi:hypothetical protein
LPTAIEAGIQHRIPLHPLIRHLQIAAEAGPDRCRPARNDGDNRWQPLPRRMSSSINVQSALTKPVVSAGLLHQNSPTALVEPYLGNAEAGTNVMSERFTETLRAANEPGWSLSVEHRFVKGLFARQGLEHLWLRTADQPDERGSGDAAGAQTDHAGGVDREFSCSRTSPTATTLDDKQVPNTSSILCGDRGVEILLAPLRSAIHQAADPSDAGRWPLPQIFVIACTSASARRATMSRLRTHRT